MNSKITFPKLAGLLADKSGRSRRFSEDFLREFFSLISETLESQESVKIKGFGTFRLSRVEPRRSVDVTTGEPIEISGHTKVVFTPSKELAEAVNSPFEAFTAIEISDDADIEQLFSKEEIELQNRNDESELQENNEGTELPVDRPVYILGRNSKDGIEEEVDNESSILKEEASIPNMPEENIEIIHETADLKDIDKAEKQYIEDIADPIEEPPAINENLTEAISVVEGHPKKEETQKSDENLTETISKEEGEPEIEEPQTTNEDFAKDISEEDEDLQMEEAPTVSENLNEAISEEVDEFEIEETRKSNWKRGLLIIFGAAMIALVATFAIWYVFATNDFNQFFKRTSATDTIEKEAGYVVGQVAPETKVSDEIKVGSEDSITDTNQNIDTEEEVPTAPSDALQYDTISTTRYLTTMAKAHYGNYNLWPYIYEENKSFLGHPDRIRPGTPVVIPKLSKYGVDPARQEDIEKAKKLGVEIYARYGKKI